MLLISRRILYLVLLSACVSNINASPLDNNNNVDDHLPNENRVENSQSAFLCVAFIEEKKFFTLCNRYTVDNGPTETDLNVQNPMEDIIKCSYFNIAPDGREYILTYIGNKYQYQIFLRDYQTGLLIYPRIYEEGYSVGLGSGFTRGFRRRGKGSGGNLPHKFTNSELSLIGGFY